MTEQLGVENEEMTPLEGFAVLAIVYSKSKDLDLARFWGREELVKKAMENGAHAVADAIYALTKSRWDQKKPLWSFLIDELADQSACDRAYGISMVAENNLRWALKVLKNQQANGGVGLDVIEKARSIVRVAYKETVGEDAPGTVVVVPESAEKEVA